MTLFLSLFLFHTHTHTQAAEVIKIAAHHSTLDQDVSRQELVFDIFIPFHNNEMGLSDLYTLHFTCFTHVYLFKDRLIGQEENCLVQVE